MELKNKVAVVTGGASGIGLATCEKLAEHELKAIALIDRSAAVHDACERLNSQIGWEMVFPFAGDVTSGEFRNKVFSNLNSRFGAVHLCIPAAGITRDRLAVRLDRETGKPDIYPHEDFESVIEINMIAPIYWAFQIVASVAQDRARRGLGQWEPSEGVQGSIVLIGSVSSAGNKGQISYATSKAGLEGAQATLAKEAIYHGVRCSIIHPGYTDTPMVRTLGDEFVKDHILPQTQLRRLLRPEEVADAICFMLRNSAVSGALWVDAGWHSTA